MQYYNKSSNTIVQVLPHYVQENIMRDYGFYPLYEDTFNEDSRYWMRTPANIEYVEQGDYYVQHWRKGPLPLSYIKKSKQEDFAQALLQIDNKTVRGGRGAVIAIYESFESPETPTPTKTLEDISILWELEEVAEENRVLLKQVLNMNAPYDATKAEEEAISMQAISIVPWLPWEEHSSTSTEEEAISMQAINIVPRLPWKEIASTSKVEVPQTMEESTS